MKTLTKIRLINWHYFENETINLKGNTLITGQNASGKSTILDAISFVLTAGDQNFNLAANEKGKRDLRGYVKCKLGSLDQEYLRDYDLSGHISLEFFSEKQEKFFCLGAIIDIVGNIQPPKILFYIIDGPMKDEYFINSEYEVKSIADFKKSRITPYLFQTRKEAKSAFRNKMGGISDKYFTLLPKALAFKPISDVKEYIYQHLLEEKEIDVTNIKESIRSYKQLETILKTTKSKIDDLSLIKDNYYKIDEIKKNQDFYNYLLKIITRNNNLSLLKKKDSEATKIENEIESIKDSIRIVDVDKNRLDENAKELYASLSQNKEFRASELYDRDIKQCENDLKYASEKERELNRRSLEYKDSIGVVENIDKKLYQVLNKISFNIDTEEDAKESLSSLSKIKEAIDYRKEQITTLLTNYTVKKKEFSDKITDCYTQLNILEKNGVPYPKEIISLRDQMQEHLYNVYKEKISVHVLSEIIEVKDDEWKDTVENLLASQRFTLIVEPRYYDDCLYCYNERKSRTMYGVNLLNTKKIQQFTQYQNNSLASIITTDNKDARLYINYIVGNLIMVDDIKDLEKYPQAITKEGMLYRGFVSRYLNPNIEKPFIGVKARDLQKKKYNELGEQLKQEFNNIRTQEDKIKELKDIITSINIDYLKELVKSKEEAISLKEKLSSLKDKKSELSLSSVNDLRHKYEDILEEIRKLDAIKTSKNVSLGTKKQALESINSNILEIINDNKVLEIEIRAIESNNVDFESKQNDIFNKENDSRSNKDIEDYYLKEIEDQKSTLRSLETALIQEETRYIQKYNRPFGVGLEHSKLYIEELNKLVESELLNYENKVREAREEAEKLFKEDFLSKLRNYILEAQDEISKINDTLNKIQFGKDKYQFVFPKSKQFGAIYDMITDNQQGQLGYSIFDEEFEKKYNQELDELFSNLSQDEENSMNNLNKYTDYRTYMDYDIKIISDTDVFYFSNISKEKSGGETQIPFYVAILASFVRLFDKAEKNGLDDSIGLLLFDEVFDKMDTQRTDAMMEFISRLNVQIMFACPPQKLEGLARHTDTTVAVFREDKKAGTFIARSK